MRLIDLDAFRADYELREHCEECGRYGKKDCDYPSYSARDFCGWLDDAPIVDAIPVKHGKWFDAMVGELPVQVCDQCKTFFPLAYTGGGHHYCPNCGAKMDLEG